MPESDAAILVTGATGFVGSALVRRLEADRRRVVPAVRRPASTGNSRQAPDLSTSADWRPALQGIATVVHAAARVHIMNDRATDPLAAFRAANVDGTLTLARQAAESGVGRFLFISSIKVNGEFTLPGAKFTPGDIPAPVDPYGISKAEAESGLQAIARETGMALVIIRPPLVYGPGVRANFESMMRWLHRGVPLPFGGIRNKRSLVALDNLVDLMIACIDHPAAPGRIFLAGDGEDMSTPELLRRVALALDTKARLIPVPQGILTVAAHLLGKPAVAQRLCSSLQVDISAARTVLDWQPPFSVDESLEKTALTFLSR